MRERYKKKFEEAYIKNISNTITENYFIKLILKVLTTASQEEIDDLMSFLKDSAGKYEWWSEWLGYSEKDIIYNIKEVFKSL